jgi:hypothetical protein
LAWFAALPPVLSSVVGQLVIDRKPNDLSMCPAAVSPAEPSELPRGAMVLVDRRVDIADGKFALAVWIDGDARSRTATPSAWSEQRERPQIPTHRPRRIGMCRQR